MDKTSEHFMARQLRRDREVNQHKAILAQHYQRMLKFSSPKQRAQTVKYIEKLIGSGNPERLIPKTTDAAESKELFVQANLRKLGIDPDRLSAFSTEVESIKMAKRAQIESASSAPKTIEEQMRYLNDQRALLEKQLCRDEYFPMKIRPTSNIPRCGPLKPKPKRSLLALSRDRLGASLGPSDKRMPKADLKQLTPNSFHADAYQAFEFDKERRRFLAGSQKAETENDLSVAIANFRRLVDDLSEKIDARFLQYVRDTVIPRWNTMLNEFWTENDGFRELMGDKEKLRSNFIRETITSKPPIRVDF